MRWAGTATCRVVRINMRDLRPLMSHRYHLPPSAHTTFLADRFVVCSFVPRPFESDPGAMKVPFFHNNDDYDEVIFYHAGNFFSRDNIHPGMITLHPGGFTHGPHPKALKNVLQQAKPATDEYAVMIDTRDALEICAGGRAGRVARLRRQLEDREDNTVKLATLKRGGRDGRLAIVSRDLTRCLLGAGIAPTLQAALDDWDTLAPRLAERAAALEANPAQAGRDALRYRAMRRAAAARLSLGGRQRLRQSRGAGAQGARRGNAGLVLDRSAGVPGRLRRLARRARRRAVRRRSLGHRSRGRSRGDHRRRPHGHRRGRRRRPHQAAHAGQRLVAAQPDSRRARQGLRLLPVQARDRIRARWR